MFWEFGGIRHRTGADCELGDFLGVILDAVESRPHVFQRGGEPLAESVEVFGLLLPDHRLRHDQECHVLDDLTGVRLLIEILVYAELPAFKVSVDIVRILEIKHRPQALATGDEHIDEPDKTAVVLDLHFKYRVGAVVQHAPCELAGARTEYADLHELVDHVIGHDGVCRFIVRDGLVDTDFDALMQHRADHERVRRIAVERHIETVDIVELEFTRALGEGTYPRIRGLEHRSFLLSPQGVAQAV